ncbi:MAG: hypothetical protein EOM35_02165 [Negativicutes bacterium]|nr:hypothetical protein [Negativicutes bacterium]
MTCKLVELNLQEPASSESLIQLVVDSLGVAREIEMDNVVVVMVSADNANVLSRGCYVDNKKALLTLINSLEDMRDKFLTIYKYM